tara:strand:+ start:509 stop:691 length:183 start_codon:yes stop_codon:yes gene_type:complete
MMVARKAPRTPNAVVSSTPVPAMAILQVFRELAGERGRQAHRPTNPPKYSYRVKEDLSAE